MLLSEVTDLKAKEQALIARGEHLEETIEEPGHRAPPRSASSWSAS